MAITKRLERLREQMSKDNLDAFFIGSQENRNYISGFTGSAGYVFITGKETFLATDFRYVEQAAQQSPLFQVIRINSGSEWFIQLISDSGVRRIGIEADK